MSKRRPEASKRVSVRAELGEEHKFHVEAADAADPEGTLATLLQAASKWASGLSPAEPPPSSPRPSTKHAATRRGPSAFCLQPLGASATSCALPPGEARGFNAEEREYLSKQPAEVRSALVASLKRASRAPRGPSFPASSPTPSAARMRS